MQHPEEGIIHAWIDGELPSEEASALEAHIAECRECAERVAEARGFVAASSRIVSALDIVPGDVIPVQQKKRRAWYSSPQLRAAAALMIVAGGSMLVMRDNKKASLDSVMAVSEQAEAPVAPAPEAAVAATIPAPQPEADMSARQNAAPKVALKEKREALRGRVGGVTVVAPPPPPPVAVGSTASDEMSAAKSSRLERDREAIQLRASAPAPMFDNVVVTGVAEAPPDLKKVRLDSTAAAIVTVFQVDSGVQVTLTDIPPKAFMADAQKVSRRMAAPQAQKSVAQGNAAAAPPQLTLNSITWVDKRGHTMTLSGLAPTARLEELRLRLPADQR